MDHWQWSDSNFIPMESKKFEFGNLYYSIGFVSIVRIKIEAVLNCVGESKTFYMIVDESDAVVPIPKFELFKFHRKEV